MNQSSQQETKQSKAEYKGNLPQPPLKDEKYIKEISSSIEFHRSFKIQKCKSKGLTVLLSYENLGDDCCWQHVSFRHSSKSVNYDDIQFIIRNFFADHLMPVMIVPPVNSKIRLDTIAVHLWANIDRDSISDIFKDQDSETEES